MVLIGLLVVAVVSLILGLTLTSTVWLIVSLAASVLAAVVLVLLVREQRRGDKSGKDDAETDGPRESGEQAQTATPASGAAGSNSAVSADNGAPHADVDTRTEAFVVDGQPLYHRADCAELDGEHGEKIPLAQAVEDGFQPCSVCRPEGVSQASASASDSDESEHGREPVLVAASAGSAGSAGSAEPTAGAPALSGAGGSGDSPNAAPPTGPQDDTLSGGAAVPQVWVADGYPEYHVEGCHELSGLTSEAIGYDDAVEDGFQPCVVCNPDAVITGRRPAELAPAGGTEQAEPEPEAATGSGVWVVDGMPDYHRDTCSRLPASGVEEIPHGQAVEDGFTACETCQPDAATAPETPTAPASDRTSGDVTGAAENAENAPADVWVVDGFPDYHRPECPQLTGLDSEAVPHDQAVEDGFTACGTCRPEDEQAPHLEPVTTSNAAAPAEPGADADAPAPATTDVPEQVWVVDGYPDFHRADCGRLAHLSAESIPGDQAVEDGFTACPTCEPLAAQAPEATSPADTGTAADDGVAVWVADGFPEFHRAGCRALAGLDDEAVPHGQAVEDGFRACQICRPEDDTAPDGFDRPESATVDVETSTDTETVQTDAAEREQAEAAEQAEREQAEREQAEREQAEREQAEREQAEREQAEREQAEREQAEAAEREQREAAEREQREAAEQAEREQAEAAEREQAEAAEREQREAAEREQAEAAEREQAEQAEREQREAAEREQAEQAEREQRDAAEQAEREQAERQQAEAERAQREAAAREAAERAEQAEREAAERKQAEQAERERAEQAEREQAEREQAERQQAEQAESEQREAAEQAEPEPQPEAPRPTAVSTSGAASGSVRRVWVLDGRPRYHAQDCLIIKGQAAVALQLDDAVEQGFQPCSLCSRD